MKKKEEKDFVKMLNSASAELNLKEQVKHELLHQYILYLVILLAVISLSVILLLIALINFLAL